MTKRPILTTTLVTGLLLAVAAGACSKSSETATSTTTVPGQASTTTTGGGGNSSSTVAGDLSKCADWVKAFYGVQGVVSVEAAKENLQVLPKLDAAAPAEVKADWQILSPLYKAMADAMIKFGPTAAQTGEAINATNAKGPQEAIVKIQTWAATCR